MKGSDSQGRYGGAVVLHGYLTLSDVTSQGFGVMTRLTVNMMVSTNVSEETLPLPVLPFQDSPGAGDLRGERTSQGTQLKK